MGKGLIIAAIVLLVIVAMFQFSGHVGEKTDKLIKDGHEYQWVAAGYFYLVHAPECDSCKRMRLKEIREALKEKDK